MQKSQSNIHLAVTLDENRVPEQIEWKASDTGPEAVNCKAMLLSVWDGKEANSMRIDLWTKEMTVKEMKLFFYQSLLSMSETLERATGEHNMAGDLRDYCRHFAEKMKISGGPASLSHGRGAGG